MSHIWLSSRFPSRTFICSPLVEQLEPRLLLAADVSTADYSSAETWNLAAMHVPEAWAQGYFGRDVVVAVVDSGVDLQQPAITSQLWTNPGEIAANGRDDDGNGYADDTIGWDFIDNNNRPDDLANHGTHIAGTIAAPVTGAVTGIGTGIEGIAPQAKIMPVRVLDSTLTGTPSSVAQGIRYAADNGADIINLSIGGAYSAAIESAIEFAAERDVLVVAAAGNDSASEPTEPARHSATLNNTISVGAYRASGTLGSFSNRVGGSGAVQVDAPGIYIRGLFAGGTTGYMSGTSMSAPHVAGLAALALSANPALTAAELRTLIVAATDGAIAGSDSRGIVNAAKAVTLAAAARSSIAADSTSHVEAPAGDIPAAPTVRDFVIANLPVELPPPKQALASPAQERATQVRAFQQNAVQKSESPIRVANIQPAEHDSKIAQRKHPDTMPAPLLVRRRELD